MAAILEGRKKPLTELRPDAKPLAEAIERAMAIEPKARFQTAAELEDALEKALPRSGSGRQALAELVALVEKDITKGRPVQSGPELEMGATTLTGSGPHSGDTATVADSVAPRR
ncbi:MAG: hypothetical protein IPM35_23970 [Myxococcales bacterium]|nr:hypothetical protein [Myxococcales bacterium]